MNPILFSSTGALNYHPNTLVANIDPEISRYYRALLPKSCAARTGKYPSHITIVRKGRDTSKNLEFWGKYEGKQVTFFYEPGVHQGKIYYWLRVLCKQFEEIRLELGLDLDGSAYALPPLPYLKYFHFTIGNSKI